MSASAPDRSGLDEPVEVLSIGTIVGGLTSTNKLWRDALHVLSSRIVELRAGTRSPLSVNVVFQVPGHIIKPDFEGTRTGSFSKKDALLMVQVALPEDVPEDTPRLPQASGLRRDR